MESEESPIKMLRTMLLFFLMITLFWQIAKRVSPIVKEFFSGQEWLMSIVSSYPLISIIFFSFFMSSYTNLFYKFGIPKETLDRMKQAKQANKEMQKQLKELRNEPEKMVKMQKEMMAKQWENMSVSMGTMFSPKFIFLVSLPSLFFLFLALTFSC